MNQKPSPMTTTGPRAPYHFWLPPEDRQIKVGPEQDEVALPQVPLPIKAGDKDDPAAPSDNLIGASVYEFLRRYPDCEYNRDYAELLRDAFPHYVADLASQAVMLSHKDVAAPYLQRLVNYLKILLLLEPQNTALAQQIGLNYYRLAMNFESLADCRAHLLAARHYLLAASAGDEPELATLSHLAQICYLFGDYADAGRHWQRLQARLDPPAAGAVNARLEALETGERPQRPLIDELEQVGEAMLLYGAGERDQARLLLEMIEERGDLSRDFPLAEFHYLLGMCRVNTGETAAAFESFVKALEIEPDFEPALEAQEALLSQGG
jgi:tetratricopeptide (TPR) repeat protein